VLVGANAKVPDAKDVRRNYAQAWSKARTEDTFGAVNAEYDLSDSLMAYAAFGARESNHDFLRHNVPVSNDAGDFSVLPATLPATSRCARPWPGCVTGSHRPGQP
jgi:iron complex outermembrane receptor protein